MAALFTVYSTSSYYDELHKQLVRTVAGDRVAMATMAFDSAAPRTKQLLEELSAACKRGVHVSFVVDAMPFLLYDGVRPGPLFYSNDFGDHLTDPFAAYRNALRELEEVGVQVAIINKPSHRFILPISGRSHIKFTVINDYVFVGGCNLDSRFAEDVDVMVGWTDLHVAEWLRAFIVRLQGEGQVRRLLNGKDEVVAMGDGTALLIDAGVRRQSLIFRRALQLIDEARRYIFISCQFFPGQATGQHLYAAYRRGVKVMIVYASPWQHDIITVGLLTAAGLVEHLRLPADFFVNQTVLRRGRLHAKVLVSEREAMVGSHNYVSAGVMLGTAEMALVSNDYAMGLEAADAVLLQLRTMGRPLSRELAKWSNAAA